jgi:hypothetical protein
MNAEKKVRDRAVRFVAKWLAHQPKASETDLRKLWQGLFFCTPLSPIASSPPIVRCVCVCVCARVCVRCVVCACVCGVCVRAVSEVSVVSL